MPRQAGSCLSSQTLGSDSTVDVIMIIQRFASKSIAPHSNEHIPIAMSSSHSRKLNHWVFVFNALQNLEDAPLKSYHEFNKIQQSLSGLIICTTPNVQFEALPDAIPGSITYMIRFLWRPQEVNPYTDWDSLLLPWILVREDSSLHGIAEIKNHRIDSKSLLVFREWLAKHRSWLWQAME
jgi:hypothetical protein